MSAARLTRALATLLRASRATDPNAVHGSCVSRGYCAPPVSTTQLNPGSVVRADLSGTCDHVRVLSHVSQDLVIHQGPRWEVTHGTRNTMDISAAASRELLFTIPARWCGLDIRTAGGRVSVDRVVEAPLAVATRGGDVELGVVRAHDVRIDTRGFWKRDAIDGELQAQELTGSAVAVRAGAVNVGRAVALTLALHSHGDTELGVVYGEEGFVCTEGGSVSVRNARFSRGLRVASRGGAVRVAGVDGRLTVDAQGGDVQVLASARCELLDITSLGAHVRVGFCRSRARLVLNATAAGGVEVQADLQVQGDVGTTRVCGQVEKPSTDTHRRSPEDMKPCTVNIDAGEGKITLYVQDWREAVQAQLLQKSAHTTDP